MEVLGKGLEKETGFSGFEDFELKKVISVDGINSIDLFFIFISEKRAPPPTKNGTHGIKTSGNNSLCLCVLKC